MKSSEQTPTTIDDAIAYVTLVKQTFSDNTAKYNEFQELMMYFKYQTIGAVDVIEGLIELFEGHPNLLYGLNKFLPQGFEIAVDEEETTTEYEDLMAIGRSSGRMDDALAYLRLVKQTFFDEKEKYDEFLQLMSDFKYSRIDTYGVIDGVQELFNGHQNLLHGFYTFLPEGYKIALDEEPTIEYEAGVGFVDNIKLRLQDREHVYKSFLDLLTMYKDEWKTSYEVYEEMAMLFHNHSDAESFGSCGMSSSYDKPNMKRSPWPESLEKNTNLSRDRTWKYQFHINRLIPKKLSIFLQLFFLLNVLVVYLPQVISQDHNDWVDNAISFS